MKIKKIKAMSLFANVGIAETFLSEIGIDVLIANEIDPQRVKFYNHLYLNTNMILGDITKSDIQEQLIKLAKNNKIDLIMATPPCQGMSTAGKKDKNDERNSLIKCAIKIIKEVQPKYAFLENVPEQLNTLITYKNEKMLIPEYIKKELSEKYEFNDNFLINAADYGVPQTRERAIILITRKDLNYKWKFPKKSLKKITLKDAIGSLPSLDPEIYDMSYADQLKMFPDFERKKEEGLKVSKWHYPPKHIYRQIYSMMHTPSGGTAFNNIDQFKPKKKDGSFTKGFKNTYKRQSWDKPGYTITMYNRTIGSQNNVHPGRFIGKDNNGYDLYSDARVLSVYELMVVTSLPENWNIPSWASEHFIRQVIGEGIPPLLVKKIMMELVKNYE
ncbi:MAG: DNA cytosine methyltransferase [Bacilli bacterium]